MCFTESADDVFKTLKVVLSTIASAQHSMRTATEDLLTTKNLSHEMVREKTFVAPTAGKRFPPSDIPETFPQDTQTQPRYPKRKRVSQVQEEEQERNQAALTRHEALSIETPVQGSFLAFTYGDEPGKGCSICKESCHKFEKGTIKILKDRKLLHEHIQHQHNLWVCSCLKWGHFMNENVKEATECEKDCYKKHLMNEPLHKRVFDRRRKAFKIPQIVRDLCARRPPGSTIDLVDKNHKLVQYTDECLCFCPTCA